jgi:hypothetical protein
MLQLLAGVVGAHVTVGRNPLVAPLEGAHEAVGGDGGETPLPAVEQRSQHVNGTPVSHATATTAVSSMGLDVADETT